MIPSAGTLKIELRREDGLIAARILPPKRLPLAELLDGKPVDEAARLVPLIYNICAAAQEASARSALGLDLPAALQARIAEETLREHVLKLCIVWPTAVGAAASREALPLVAAAATDQEAAARLRGAILGQGASLPDSWAAFAAWMDAGSTAPARAFAAVAGWDPDWGLAELPAFEPSAAVDWQSATQMGRAVENSAAARVAAAPLMAAIAERRERGVMWRMAARLVEVDWILSGHPLATISVPGTAQAARGAMIAEASTEHGMVTSFRRLSPTDFALAPGGLLDTALATLPADPRAPLRAVAQMVVETIDPCVVTELEMADA